MALMISGSRLCLIRVPSSPHALKRMIDWIERLHAHQVYFHEMHVHLSYSADLKY